MATLVSLLDRHRGAINRSLRLCKENWESLLQACDSELLHRRGWLNDEEVWTFLAACGYAIAGRDGVASLTEKLTGQAGLPQPEFPQIWLEYRPMTPRVREGRTHLDLAVGSIEPEAGTTGGIELGRPDGANSWICFCEMKWESDISPKTSNDANRNQLVRVIESALYFQAKGIYADRVYVNLVTPKVFQGERGSGKLYQRKFAEYESSKSNIIVDLDDCKLPVRNQFNAMERIDALSIRWTTFDELFLGLPDSAISNGLKQFWCRYGSYLEG